MLPKFSISIFTTCFLVLFLVSLPQTVFSNSKQTVGTQKNKKAPAERTTIYNSGKKLELRKKAEKNLVEIRQNFANKLRPNFKQLATYDAIKKGLLGSTYLLLSAEGLYAFSYFGSSLEPSKTAATIALVGIGASGYFLYKSWKAFTSIQEAWHSVNLKYLKDGDGSNTFFRELTLMQNEIDAQIDFESQTHQRALEILARKRTRPDSVVPETLKSASKPEDYFDIDSVLSEAISPLPLSDETATKK